MANATVTRLGQINQAGDELALFLKVFAGEVLTTFLTKNVVLDKHQVRTIASGKTAQHPVMGLGSAAYHTPGVELVGTDVGRAERLIDIDGLLIADRFIALIDEAMNHYDVRGPHAEEMGHSLARALDRNVLQTMLLAARATATITGNPGGTAITSAGAGTVADDLIAAIKLASQRLDENDVPEDDRFAYLRPAQYNLALDGTKIVNRDYVESNNGGVDTGRIFQINGIALVKTNNSPVTNITTGLAKYQVDASTTVATITHRSAVGTTKLLDLTLESEYDIRRQGTLLVAKYSVGHGILRPEAAVEIKTA